MRRYFFIAAILPLLLACNADKQTNPHLITPGKSIGEISIGQNADSLTKVMGKPDTSNAAMGSSMHTWYDKHDTSAVYTRIFAQRNMGNADENIAHVKKIMSDDPQYKTAEGVGIGNTLNEIGRYYGMQPTGNYMLKGKPVLVYSDLPKGISFDIDNESRKCVAVAVFSTAEPNMAYINVH